MNIDGKWCEAKDGILWQMPEKFVLAVKRETGEWQAIPDRKSHMGLAHLVFYTINKDSNKYMDGSSLVSEIDLDLYSKITVHDLDEDAIHIVYGRGCECNVEDELTISLYDLETIGNPICKCCEEPYQRVSTIVQIKKSELFSVF